MPAWIMPPSAAGMKTSHSSASSSSGVIGSPSPNSLTLPPSRTCTASASGSSPSSAWIAPWASETAITVQPSWAMMRAAHEPTLPKPWSTTRHSSGRSPSAGAASRNMWTMPRPVAASRP